MGEKWERSGRVEAVAPARLTREAPSSKERGSSHDHLAVDE